MRFITTHGLRKVARPSAIWEITAPVKAWSMAPGLWQDVPGLEDYAGTVVYEKAVTCAGTLRFVFGGVAGTCRAWLDGALLCEHTGSGSFAALMHNVEWGQHLLRVEISCDQPGCGGFTGDVAIEQMGSAFISSMKIATREDGLADVRVKVRSLAKKMQVADIECTVAGAELQWKKRLLPPGAEVTLKGSVQTSAEAWSRANPVLHGAEAVLWLEGEPADDLRARVGFQAEMGEGTFVPFTVPQPESMLKAVQQVMRDGAQGIKVTGAPDGLLDICDQLGMPVWDTAPVYEGCHVCVMREGDA